MKSHSAICLVWGLSDDPKRTGENPDNLFFIVPHRSLGRRRAGAEHAQGPSVSLWNGCSHIGIPTPQSSPPCKEQVPSAMSATKHQGILPNE